MRYQTHNDRHISSGGSSGQGHIETTYSLLVAAFGQPYNEDTHKSDAEWEVIFDDGTYATIYNYKNGKNYLGECGLSPRQITTWHIGGTSKLAVERVEEVLKASYDMPVPITSKDINRLTDIHDTIENLMEEAKLIMTPISDEAWFRVMTDALGSYKANMDKVYESATHS